MPTSPSLPLDRKQHWWLSNRKVVDTYIGESRALIATREPANVSAALGILDAALAISPRADAALELKARSLLFLGRFGEVADMLRDYIPSYNGDDSTNSSLSSDSAGATLLVTDSETNSFRCFSVSEWKRKLMDGISTNRKKEGYWRYLILGKACYHLGLIEDAMVLLQTGRRLATAASRHGSTSQSDDDFANSTHLSFNPLQSESESASLLSHAKLLRRRRSAALAALDAGVPSESIRHFTKILETRRGTPHAFAAACFVGRASAYRAAGRFTESIADCNRALALDPSSIPALRVRTDLFESVRALPDCLRDLDHLKLLYDLILRDRKLPGPAWRPHYGVRYRDVPSILKTLAARIRECRQRVASGEGYNVDYYALFGVKRGCARSELDRAHLLLSLKHNPDTAAAFADRLEFADGRRDLDSVREQARMSASILFRMLHKGYASIMSSVKAEEAAAAAAALKPATTGVAVPEPVYRGVFCRDIAAVESILSRAGFNRGIPVKHEAVSC